MAEGQEVLPVPVVQAEAEAAFLSVVSQDRALEYLLCVQFAVSQRSLALTRVSSVVRRWFWFPSSLTAQVPLLARADGHA